jgi:drug/metabolite transporter (DMT)-like permease
MMSRLAMPARRDTAEVTALLALLAGALVIGSSAIFVRLSETGPTATAFWRGVLALPPLAVWALIEQRREAPGRSALVGLARTWREPGFLWAGVFFAGDLALWHASLLLTSVAASTLEANCAPLVVTLGAWALWGERPRAGFLASLALAFGGLTLVVSTKFGHREAGFGGDLLGLGTACFYGFYILVVARLRRRYGSGVVMLNSTLVFSALLLPLALRQKFLPDTAYGWLLLWGCALSAQALGQGLVTYALARLPATFSAVGLYVAAIAAIAYAWLLLGERLTPWQLLGGGIVLGAIALARRARPQITPGPQPPSGTQPMAYSSPSQLPK